MIVDFLAKYFIKNKENLKDPKVREDYSKLANIFFMVVMGLMGVVKFSIGNSVGSLAITSSSFADFSDILLALMMMLSMHFANRKPDAKHPFGYARIEYITGMVVSFVVLLLGFELLMSSIEKIREPVAPEVSIPAYAIMTVSVAINFIVFSVNSKVGKLINSVAIKAAATKNVVDGIASAVVVLGLILFGAFKIDLDGYMGVLMSVLILYSAVMSLKDTINPLLGLTPDLEFSNSLREKVLAYPQVIGVHNEIIHNYGNNRCYVSLHAEFSSRLSTDELHQVIDDIENDFAFEGISLNIHFDLIEVQDDFAIKIATMLNKIRNNISKEIQVSDLKIMPMDDLTYLFFTITLPRQSKIDPKNIKEQFINQIDLVDKNYKAAISVNYKYI